ncbi:MAG TPA: ABC transporter permease [Chloroflexota bacterium]|jgi:peptide/nickel transport system permease protein|nr:ABC transporter permease [Chloroflexota bacterium]
MAVPARVIRAGPPRESAAATDSIASSRRQRSLWTDARRSFLRHHLATAGAAVFLLLILATLVGPLVYHVKVSDVDFAAATAPPSFAHPFGTDDLGQDVLARVLWGGRISIAVGLFAMLISITVGTLVGSLAGFFGGFFDNALMRLTDVFISIPQLPLLLLIIYLFRDQITHRFGTGGGIFLLLVGVIGGLNWMSTARLVRAGFLSVREKEFMQAARCIGVPARRQIMRHILPNVLSPVIVAGTLSVGSAIIAESTLSFLGLGFPPDVPTWGRMLYDAQNYLSIAPWMALFPGLMIFLAVLSINYVGDGLRDALDPRLLT